MLRFHVVAVFWAAVLTRIGSTHRFHVYENSWQQSPCGLWCSLFCAISNDLSDTFASSRIEFDSRSMCVNTTDRKHTFRCDDCALNLRLCCPTCPFDSVIQKLVPRENEELLLNNETVQLKFALNKSSYSLQIVRAWRCHCLKFALVGSAAYVERFGLEPCTGLIFQTQPRPACGLYSDDRRSSVA